MKGKKERMKIDSIYQVFKPTSKPTKGGLILLSMLCLRRGARDRAFHLLKFVLSTTIVPIY